MDPEPERAPRTAQTAGTFPCPCCGYLVHDEGPGSYGICPICGWEDDLVQLRWPTYEGGANHLSLLAAQRRYLDAEPSPASHAVTPHGIARDVGWRPLDPARDALPDPDRDRRPWPEDRTELYWWRPDYLAAGPHERLRSDSA